MRRGSIVALLGLALVAGGVARSRSDALAWCVRLVGMHQKDWIKGLRDALVKVDEARGKGPLN